MRLLTVTLKRTLLAACCAGSFYPMSLWADQGTTQEQQSPAVFDSIWSLSELYKNNENSYIQKFDLVGRYHGQYWIADSEGNYDNDWENRRMYVGFNTRFFHNFTIEVQISITDDFDPFYNALYDAFLQWEDDAGDFAISIGRLDYVYTGLERTGSSKKIKTMERALLVNQVMPGEVVGIYLKDKKGTFSYQAGLFCGSIEDEFTSFEGGFSALLGIGYELPLFYDKGVLHLDYLYNNGHEDNNAFKLYGNIVSLWHEGHRGPLEIGIDLTAAGGVDEQSNVFGLTLLPAYDLFQNLILGGDKLQLALRYHYASSSDDYGLQFNKRYEQPVTSGKGDSYNSYYVGLNYYLYQQKLKLMSGIEYFNMGGVADDDEVNTLDGDRSVDGWNFISGVRLYF
jgi:hypothetical protein